MTLYTLAPELFKEVYIESFAHAFGSGVKSLLKDINTSTKGCAEIYLTLVIGHRYF